MWLTIHASSGAHWAIQDGHWQPLMASQTALIGVSTDIEKDGLVPSPRKMALERRLVLSVARLPKN